MKGTMLAVLITMSIFFSGALPSTGRRSLPLPRVPTGPPHVLVGPEPRGVSPRDCVGLPRRVPSSLPGFGAPLSLVTSGLPHWS
jgi:hypothetical protein